MRRVATGILVAAGLACAPAPRTPTETVERYLEALARDPVRTLVLVTPEFHDRHGLRFEEVADRPFAAPAAPRPAVDPELERERARLGWLTVLTKRIFALQHDRFRRRVLSERVLGDRAEVAVRVEGAGAPPLDVRFDLRARPWRIDAVHLPALDESQWVGAFLVAPDAELHRRIRDLRQRPGG